MKPPKENRLGQRIDGHRGTRVHDRARSRVKPARGDQRGPAVGAERRGLGITAAHTALLGAAHHPAAFRGRVRRAPIRSSCATPSPATLAITGAIGARRLASRCAQRVGLSRADRSAGKPTVIVMQSPFDARIAGVDRQHFHVGLGIGCARCRSLVTSRRTHAQIRRCAIAARRLPSRTGARRPRRRHARCRFQVRPAVGQQHIDRLVLVGVMTLPFRRAAVQSLRGKLLRIGVSSPGTRPSTRCGRVHAAARPFQGPAQADRWSPCAPHQTTARSSRADHPALKTQRIALHFDQDAAGLLAAPYDIVRPA